MKKFLLIIALPVLAFSAKASDVSVYKLSDDAIDALFNSSEDVSFLTPNVTDLMNDLSLKTTATVDDDKQMIAGIIALASLIITIGILVPIHRLYLGTGGQTVKIFFLYFCTLSGCGFITLIDGIMLLINSSSSKYIDNPKFIMW